MQKYKDELPCYARIMGIHGEHDVDMYNNWKYTSLIYTFSSKSACSTSRSTTNSIGDVALRIASTATSWDALRKSWPFSWQCNKIFSKMHYYTLPAIPCWFQSNSCTCMIYGPTFWLPPCFLTAMNSVPFKFFIMEVQPINYNSFYMVI